MGRLLRGSTVGIVGLGRVGKALAALLQPFEADILAYDPVPDRAFAEERGIRFGELGELLADSDIVCLHLPYGPKAHHIVGAAELASMKKDAVLVNTSRGGLVDEAALADHLRENTGALAYLDTFEEEPYSGPLAELDNVVLTPHIGTYARECRVRMELEAVDNLLAVLRP